MKNIICIIVLLITFFSCEKKVIPSSSTPVQPVKNDLTDLIAKFNNEAEIRGKKVNTQNFSIILDAILSKGYVGLCEKEQNRVRLDSTFWNKMSIYEKELLLFHELGHCILGRGHLNTSYANGEYKSLMRAGDSNFGDKAIDFYGKKRKYYLDELFDETIVGPDWINKGFNYNDIKKEQKIIIFNETFDNNNNNWFVKNTKDTTVKIENGIYNVQARLPINTPLIVNISENFEIEFDFKSQGPFSLFYFGDSKAPTYNYTLFILDYNSLTGSITPPYSKVFGFSINCPSLRQNEFNKFTIRKIDDTIYFFINEKPFFENYYISFEGKQSLWFGSRADAQFDNVLYSKITN